MRPLSAAEIWQSRFEQARFERCCAMAEDSSFDPGVAGGREVLAYRVNDFCQAIGVGRTSFYRMVKDGQIRTVLVAGRRVVPASEAKRLLSNIADGEKNAA
jgi:hypothetical protein